MSISREEVERVAYLARLELTEAEIEQYREQLSRILEAMETLKELDTEHIPPTAQVIPLTNVMRDDEVRPAWPKEAILKNAPRREGDYFRVPPVLE